MRNSVKVRWLLGVVAAGFVLAVGSGFVRVVRAQSEADGAAEARHAYSEKIAAGYNKRFGEKAYFLPSNATTDTGEFLDSKNFFTAKYCGHCHTEAHEQWKQTAH